MNTFLERHYLRNHILQLLLLFAFSTDLCFSSEGAVRECCEPMSPTPSFSTVDFPQDYYTSTEINQSGDNLQANTSTGNNQLNCIMAKQVCMDDPMCGPTIDIVDRVCGSEVVSCSTVTVTKCQAALRTLQTFPFFNPICLCREPQVDSECNVFRTFLFDHPCLFANRREKDPYPIDSLVSCTHAHSICKTDANCLSIYDHFKHVCRTNEEDKCIPELQESCKESWSQIRLTPMFGCICPPNLWQGQKKCDRHFNFVNHNRCAGSDLPIDTNDALMNFQSTCVQAMEMCEKNLKCAVAISAIMTNCKKYMCKRNECQRSLQAFYRDKSLVMYAVEIAFCLCKKTNNSEESTCMEAQDTLHPSCAQEVDSISLPACHTIATSCRDDPECGPFLEEFEQLCAADNYTKTCAGHPAQCRIGMLGILGTILRTHCACKGTDRVKLYECMGWQRVLWFNPCVVEAQREFHMNKVRARLSRKHNNASSIYDETLITVPTEIETRTITTTVTRPLTMSTTRVTATLATRPTSMTTRRTPATSRTKTSTTTSPTATSTSFTPAPLTTTKVPKTTTTRTKFTTTTTPPPPRSTLGTVTITEPATKIIPNIYITHQTESYHRILFEKTTVFTTTRRPILSKPRYRTTFPPNVPGCILQKTSLDEEIFVAEGKATRVHHDLETECSEMCHCAPGSELRCQTECVTAHSCKTDLALYKHGAPAYQAFRGRCICYSGKFICMRPKSGSYSIPPGVFLYLAYSSIDENLTKKHIDFELQDSVNEFQALLDKKITPDAACHLSLFSVAEENAILIAKFKNTSSNAIRQINIKPTLEEITKDRESCISGLESLAKSVNEQHYDIKTNVFLSIFKLGEVDVTYPEESSISIRNSISKIFLFLPFSIYMICC